jgi:hypothetical protein
METTVHVDPSRPAPPPSTLPQDANDMTLEDLAAEYGSSATVVDRCILLPEPVTQAPHLAVLHVLGFAAKASPVGAAAHGPAGVAAGVWRAPELYLARWSPLTRWVSAYKFPAGARPDDYLREGSSIPKQLDRGSWTGPVPDEVAEAFFAVGLLLDEPPFPVPPPPRQAPKPAPASSPAPRKRAAPAAPRPRKKAAPPPRRAEPQYRSCPGCNLQKHLSQFVPDSDLCVDCR